MMKLEVFVTVAQTITRVQVSSKCRQNTKWKGVENPKWRKTLILSHFFGGR